MHMLLVFALHLLLQLCCTFKFQAVAAAAPFPHVGRWSAPPAYCGTRSNGGNTDAPLLGNGDLGVNLCGDAAAPTLYFGKNDFWSTYNSDVTHNMYQSLANVGRLSLDLSALGTPSEYSLSQHLHNATVASAFAYEGGARFSMECFVAADANALIATLFSSQDINLTMRLSTGSALGTARGLPVAAGGDGSSAMHVARNSSSASNAHPSAVARDCRDHLLDSFGQQSFHIGVDGALSVVGGGQDGRGASDERSEPHRCLLLMDDTSATRAPTASATPASVAGVTAPDWKVFRNINAMYYPTPSSNIHAIGKTSDSAACMALATNDTKCAIFAWSESSSECYCREDGVWEYTAQAGKVSGCIGSGPRAVKGCTPSPAPHPAPGPHPRPPTPPAAKPCTASNSCFRVSSAANSVECAQAGSAAAWVVETNASGASRITTQHVALGLKLCLTNSARGDPKARCGAVGACPHRLEARPCNASDDVAQLWSFGGDARQFRSESEPGTCLTAIPPVPLIRVAAAAAVADGSGAITSASDSYPSRTLSDGSVEVNTTVHVKANRRYTFAVAVLSSRDESGDLVAAATSLAAKAATASGKSALRAAHAQWWQAYWNASSVQLGPQRQTLESFWYGMQYMAGCMNRPGKQATGLWGPWIQTDEMNWNGDYTLVRPRKCERSLSSCVLLFVVCCAYFLSR